MREMVTRRTVDLGRGYHAPVRTRQKAGEISCFDRYRSGGKGGISAGLGYSRQCSAEGRKQAEVGGR